VAVEDAEPAGAVGEAGAELPDVEVLRSQVREKYRQVAVEPAARYHFHTGRPLAARLGYDPGGVDRLPDRAVESFAGVANPFSLRELRAGARNGGDDDRNDRARS
jgi:arsenite methyltransferase